VAISNLKSIRYANNILDAHVHAAGQWLPKLLMDHSQKTKVAAWASTVTSTAFQISLVVFNRWLNAHLSGLWVIPLWALSGGLWIWFFASRQKIKLDLEGRGRKAESTEAAIAVAGDVSGSVLDTSSGHSFLGGSAFIGDSAIKEVLADKRLPPKNMPHMIPPQLPSLRSFPRWITADYGFPGCWKKLEPHTLGTRELAVCYFENPAAPKNGVGIPLKRVEAHLKFYSSTETVTINTAYWLQEDANRIDIPAGHERAVVIGHFEGTERFVTYENKFSYSHSSEWNMRPCCDEVSVPVPHHLKIEVVLIELGGNQTVDEAVIEIDVMTCNIRKV